MHVSGATGGNESALSEVESADIKVKMNHVSALLKLSLFMEILRGCLDELVAAIKKNPPQEGNLTNIMQSQ